MRRSRCVQHQRCQQCPGDHGAHRRLDHDLADGARRESDVAGQRRRGDDERHPGDGRHHPAAAGQLMHAPDGHDRQLGQQHAGGEPREQRRQPVHLVDAEGQVPRQRGPREAGHRQRRDRGHAPVHRQPARQQCQQRQDQIEADLDGQAPHLGEPGRQRQGYIDLGECEIGEPHREVCVGVGQQRQDHHDRDQVARHDADDARAQVVTRRRSVPQTPRGRGVAAPQQEARQREEHRHRQVEAGEQPAVPAAAVGRLERHVSEYDSHGGTGPHALDSGQETAGAAHLSTVRGVVSLVAHDPSVPGARGRRRISPTPADHSEGVP